MSTTAEGQDLGNPFGGMADIDGNPIPGDGDPAPQGQGENQEPGIGELADGLRQAAEERVESEARLDGEEETDAGHEGLFDKTNYDDPSLQIAKVDGQSIDKIGLTFSGSLKLDRANADDCQLFRRMMLGKTVTLKVDAKVTGIATKGKDDPDGNTGEVVEVKTLTVDTIYPLSVED
jgi:hypothetical protein